MSAIEACIFEKCTEEGKLRKYTVLAEAQLFQSIAVEIMRGYGGPTGVLLRAIDYLLMEATGVSRVG